MKLQFNVHTQTVTEFDFDFGLFQKARIRFITETELVLHPMRNGMSCVHLQEQ